MDISVSDTKDIIYHFLVPTKKYGWGWVAIFLDTGSGSNNIFRKVEQIKIEDIQHQSHVYFGLIVIGNLWNQVLPKNLVVSALQTQPTIHRKFKNMKGCTQIW